MFERLKKKVEKEIDEALRPIGDYVFTKARTKIEKTYKHIQEHPDEV